MEEVLLSLVYHRKTFVKQHLWARRWVAAKSNFAQLIEIA